MFWRAGAGQDRLQRGVQADHHAPRAQALEHPGLDHQAAAAGDHRALGRVAALDELALQLAEGGLALGGEEFRDRAAPLPLDLMVAVQAGEAQPLRDRAADGGLAGAHEADQI